MFSPRVSVLMEVSFGIDFLRLATESILRQTFTDFEFIIVANAPKDGILKVLQDFQAQDSRISILTIQDHVTLAEAMNQAFALSHGEYIARMDADDIAFPDRLQKEVNFLDHHSEVGLVGGQAVVIDKDGRETGENLLYPLDQGSIFSMLIKTNPFCHPSVMMRRSVLEKVGGYDTVVVRAQDYHLWFKVIKQTRVANLPEALLRYRISGASASVRQRRISYRSMLSAQWRAIKNGLYPWWNIIYCVRTVILLILPVSLVRRIKRRIRKV